MRTRLTTIDIDLPLGDRAGAEALVERLEANLRFARGNLSSREQYRTKLDLAAAREHLASLDSCPFTNWGFACTLPNGHDGDHVPPEEINRVLP